jgi:hypothetical protein
MKVELLTYQGGMIREIEGDTVVFEDDGNITISLEGKEDIVVDRLGYGYAKVIKK